MNHNLDLDIQNYSFYEILNLFDIDANNVNLDDLKRAKKKVVMMHPDKSKLPKEYFLFYKKAFDIVMRMYDNVVKMSAQVEDKDYSPVEMSKSETDAFEKSLKKMPKEQFQKQFNRLFEKHMKTPVNADRNAWFTQEESTYNVQVANASQMNQALDQIRDNQQSQSIVKYQGIRSLHEVAGNGVNSFYERSGTNDDEADEEYVSCDPFSKLKYDDLRKVHKDQTVFSVRESDYAQVPQYRSVGEYERARTVKDVQPMEQSRAQSMMEEQEKFLQAKIRQKQYQSEMATMRHMEANQQVMSNFLRLT
jgi:hypothetical protein